ncbi:MAG: DUF192 domain-containing protein [Minisyncoccia bacterium]|jgi:uncharacterized membrane protein (UPF0127 family)
MYTGHRGVIGFVVFIVGFTAGVTVASLYYLQRIQTVTDRVNIKINDQYIVAEIAKDEASRDKGLSGRDSIGLNEGMYFIFDAPGSYGFWMKGMKFPIDIVWISNGKIVGFEDNMQPPADPNASDSTLKNYLPPEPIDRALELHAGRIGLLKAKVGDNVLVKPLLPTQPVAAAAQQ